MGGHGSYVPFLSGFDAELRIGAQFLLEGLATVIVAGFAYFYMHDVCILLSFHLLLRSVS